MLILAFKIPPCRYTFSFLPTVKLISRLQFPKLNALIPVKLEMRQKIAFSFSACQPKPSKQSREGLQNDKQFKALWNSTHLNSHTEPVKLPRSQTKFTHSLSLVQWVIITLKSIIIIAVIVLLTLDWFSMNPSPHSLGITNNTSACPCLLIPGYCNFC